MHSGIRREGFKKFVKKRILRNYELYLFLLPTIIVLLIFHYWPMYGIQIAFKEYIPTKGITGSPWVGLENFRRFFKSYAFGKIIRNTIAISLYSLIAGFPVPVILALLLNQLNSLKYKKVIQTVTYAPHFISDVVLVGMLALFLSPRSGIVNQLLKLLGMEPILFMGEPGMFRHIYVWSGIWKEMGWSSIIYLAALTAVSPELHEAAIIDGATKIQRIRHIDLPSILPTITIMFILRMGRVMNVGFEKVFLMQNSLNLEVSEVISTYVYKRGLIGAEYSYSAAIGLFNSLINFVLLITFNRIAKSVGETSLW